MQTGTPNMQNFWPSSPYAYGESPYAYGDQFLTDQRSFCQSRVEAEFCARTLAHSHQKSSVSTYEGAWWAGQMGAGW